jgi:transposase
MAEKKTDRSACRFTVQQARDGKPFLAVQLYRDTIPVLREVSFGFDLLRGTQVEEARRSSFLACGNQSSSTAATVRPVKHFLEILDDLNRRGHRPQVSEGYSATALEIATGKVVAHVRNRRTSVNFLRFMNDVVRAYPNRELHVVVDNLNIHKNEAARRWLVRHPQVYFHYTPTHASWVNLIECFFSILSKQGLAHSVQHSKQDLKELLHRFLASYNQTCNPFTWTKGPERLQRIIETTKDYQALHPRKPRRRPAQRKQAVSIRN